MEDLHGMIRDLERRIAALEAHPHLRPEAKKPTPLIRNMSEDGPKPDVSENNDGE